MIKGKYYIVLGNKVIYVEKKTSDLQRKILRILYVWSLEHFTDYLKRDEFIVRIGVDDPYVTNELVRDLEEKGFVETAPLDEPWEVIRITPDGVKTLRITDII